MSKPKGEKPKPKPKPKGGTAKYDDCKYQRDRKLT